MTAVPDVCALVCEDDQQHRRVLRRGLLMAGIAVHETSTAEEAELAVQTVRPDVLVLDLHLGELTGIELIRRLRSRHRTALVPIICVTGDTKPDTLAEAFAAGADDYLRKPFDADELACRIRVAVQRRATLGSLSPLTGLPGNVVLTEELTRRLHAGPEVAMAHIDIDHFKPYNDRYGYVRGDRVIAALAELLVAAVERCPDAGLFPAHIGGDDFALVGPPGRVEAVAGDLLAAFDDGVPALYDAEDLRRGGVVTADRSGALRRHPLVSLSIGIAVHGARRFDTAAEFADVAAECRREAKRHPGSALVVDRRRAPAARPAMPAAGR